MSDSRDTLDLVRLGAIEIHIWAAFIWGFNVSIEASDLTRDDLEDDDADVYDIIHSFLLPDLRETWEVDM